MTGSKGTLRIVDQIDSTNAELLRLPIEQVPEGAALLALTQSGGRGRSERVWESPPGGMYLSVSLRPKDLRGLALLGAKAVVDLLAGYGLVAEIRWPNDVMVAGQKIAGVLPVARFQGNRLERAVLGVGLNVSQPLLDFSAPLRPTLTTLELQRPNEDWVVERVAREYLGALWLALEFLDCEGLAALVERCEECLEGRDSERSTALVSANPSHSVRHLAPISGLAEDGALLLRDGTRLDSLAPNQRLRFADELS